MSDLLFPPGDPADEMEVVDAQGDRVRGGRAASPAEGEPGEAGVVPLALAPVRGRRGAAASQRSAASGQHGPGLGSAGAGQDRAGAVGLRVAFQRAGAAFGELLAAFEWGSRSTEGWRRACAASQAESDRKRRLAAERARKRRQRLAFVKLCLWGLASAACWLLLVWILFVIFS